MAEALGVARIFGSPHRQPIAFVFTNAAFVEAYLSAMALVHLTLSGLNFAVGYGLRRLQGWTRWVQVALATILSLLLGSSCVLGAPEWGLLGAFVAVIPSVWVTYLLLSPKGKMIFSPEYQQIRAGTRLLWPKSLLWVAMGLIPLAFGILALVDWSTVQVAIAIKRLTG